MGIYTSFAANLLFPLHEKLKKHSTLTVKRDLERSQWLKPEEILALQLARLREFLTQCALHVPYYHDLFRSLDFDPKNIRAISDLARLPL
ncbi:MAG TPA: capsule biosynthesis protein CapK, partial [Candidatus Accumulibacter sp.]|nr:capsule biosynthesis protein CapK [Accumulibacter sp.]